MIKNSGFIVLSRELLENVIWTDKPFSRGQAWIDLIYMANYKEKDCIINAKKIHIDRGTFITSEGKLGDRWGWGRDKVRRFLKFLVDNESITKIGTREHTTVTIVNYDVYQLSQPTCHTTDQQPTEQLTNNRPYTTNKRNKRNKEKEIKEETINPFLYI